jgi:uncharacterized phage-associated protein
MSQQGQMPIRFAASAAKALEVILWLAERRPGIGLYHLVKAVFFADKFHLCTYGRPLFGESYRAAPFGPLPQVVYGLLRNQPIEVLAAGLNGPLPFRIEERFSVFGDRAPNLRKLSKSDREALEFGLQKVEGRSFEELYQLTHRDLAWHNASGGAMDYRDFIPLDDDDRQRRIAFIEDLAPVAVF